MRACVGRCSFDANATLEHTNTDASSQRQLQNIEFNFLLFFSIELKIESPAQPLIRSRVAHTIFYFPTCDDVSPSDENRRRNEKKKKKSLFVLFIILPPRVIQIRFTYYYVCECQPSRLFHTPKKKKFFIYLRCVRQRCEMLFVNQLYLNV